MLRLAILLLIPAVALAEPAKPATHQIKLDGQTFTLPVGFTIERVAGPPQVDRPIVASFDDRGRLYVADSSGSNDKVADQLKNPTHRIVRLEDADGDGKFEKATVFADKMMFPEGILWHRGHVYCAAPPHIWNLTDTDDDGKADKREVWSDGKTLTGCANDLHGPYLGPDGWLYWCKGAFAKQEYTLPTGKKFTTRASHIFRAKPDGTGIEPVMTGGMDNPVDVAFLPNGERFFTTTFFQHPAAGKRDGLIHAVYGGIYGKDHDVIHDPDHKWTSPDLMPVMTHMGPAAPCGLHCYESDAFGKEYTTNLFACQFNLRKVSRHVLKPKGASYETEDHDFLVSDSQDFHPTDVIEDADGSLLVVNTGGWYKLCCPSSQLVKADVLGAIYRIRKADVKKVEDARGLKFDWRKANPANLLGLLADPRPAVRNRAIDELAQRDDSVLQIVRDAAKKGQPALVRQNALWALIRHPQPKEELDAIWLSMAFFDAAFDDDPGVRQVAMHCIALRRDEKMSKPVFANLTKAVDDKRWLEARITAEALGRIGSSATVDMAILALGLTDDPVMQHALIYSIIEVGDVKRIRPALAADDDMIRRGVLIALDQLGEKLDVKLVLEAMKSKNPSLREAGEWIAGRHREWAGDLVNLFRERLAEPKDDLTKQLAKFGSSPAIQELLADVVADGKGKDRTRIAAMQAMAQAGLKVAPEAWFGSLEAALEFDETQDLHKAVLATVRALPPKGMPDSLVKKVRSVGKDSNVREITLGAIAALPGNANEISLREVSLILASAEHDTIQSLRGLAVEALAKAKLDAKQLEFVIGGLPKIGPLELDRVLAVFAQTKDDEIGKKLVAALNNPQVRPALRVDGVKERIKHFGPAVQAEAEKLYAELNKDYQQQKAKLDEAVKTLKPGDVRRGQLVFNSQKTSCIACHTIGYVGGKIGPDLTRIGGIRNERDLLESILFPSSSFVRSYEPLSIVTKDQKTFNGVPKKDSPEEVVLILAADKEVRIPREEVDEVRPGKVSIMPDGLDKQLTPQELADLIAFLRACK